MTEQEKDLLFNGEDYNKQLRDTDGFILATIAKKKDGEGYEYSTEYETSQLIDDKENAYKHMVNALTWVIQSYATENALNPHDFVVDIESRLQEDVNSLRDDSTVTMFRVNALGMSAPKKLDYEAVVALMDDDLREEIHQDIAPCSKQMFFEEYCVRHLKKFGKPFEMN